MYHSVIFYDNVEEFEGSMLFRFYNKDIFAVVEGFEKQFPNRKVVGVIMFDGVQWIKRNFVGWETI